MIFFRNKILLIFHVLDLWHMIKCLTRVTNRQFNLPITSKIKKIVNELCCSTSGDSTFSSGDSVVVGFVGVGVGVGVVVFKGTVVKFLIQKNTNIKQFPCNLRQKDNNNYREEM